MICGGALIILGSDRLHNTTAEKFFYSIICFLNIFLILSSLKTNDWLTVGINGILTLFLLIFLVYKFLDLTKMILLIDGWVIVLGIVFYFWPNFAGFETLIYWIQNNLFLFATIWILEIIFLLILSILSLKGNKTALLIFSWAVALPSLIFSIINLTVGIGDFVLYGGILAVFSFSLPIWLYIEPLGSLTRAKLLNAFSWWLIIIIIGTILSFYTQNLFKVFLTSDLSDRANNVSKTIETYLNERKLVVQGFQNSDQLIQLLSAKKIDLPGLEKELKELYLVSRKFLRIIVTDKNGKIISSYPSDSSLVDQDVNNQMFFQETKNSTQITISDFIGPTPPVSYVSGRLSGADGEFLGIVSGIIDVSDINDRLQDFKYDEQTLFLITDNKGNILIGDNNQINQEQNGAIEAFATVKNYDWKITVKEPFKNLSGKDKTIASIVFLTSIISAISSLFIMLYTRRRTVVE